MSNLKEFQHAAVERIVHMLDRNRSGRFLLADEVGLGKTLIARGVIEKLSKTKSGRFTVVYLCSNLEIAAQNAEKLAPQTSSAKPLKDRLTLMTLGISSAAKSKMRIFSFTPGTSLNLGRSTGIMRERRLLLYMISQGFGQRLVESWQEFFRCGAGEQGWYESTTLPKLRNEFGDGKVKPSFLNRWRSLARNQTVKLFVNAKDQHEYKLFPALDEECVTEFNQSPEVKWIRRNRNVVIGELRKCLAVASLDYLDPDLVVMDEFQRFKDILDNSRQVNSVESELLAKPGTKVLILSATPYKMYTMRHEDEDHHQDFLGTYAFLNKCEPEDRRVIQLKTRLASFRQDLEKITAAEIVDEALMAKKRSIESDLKQVMCRTERNRYIIDSKKGITEIPPDGEDTSGVLPHQGELSQYIQLRRFLLEDEHRAKNYGRSIMDFWKSGPSLLSFMGGHYSLIKKLRENNELVPRHLLLPEAELRKSHKLNLKFRQLFQKVFNASDEPDGESAPDDWPFLWLRPRYTYYKDVFYGDRAPRKILIFSHWHFVPKTVAFLTSSEVERRLKFNRDKAASSLLTFNKGRPYIFNIAIPSLALAKQIDVLGCSATSSETPDRSEVESMARRQLLDSLTRIGIKYQRNGRSSKTWRIIAAIEAEYCLRQGGDFAERMHAEITWDGLTPSTKERSHNQWFRYYQKNYGAWFWQWLDDEFEEELLINEKILRRILDIALYSPATMILRSLLRISESILEVHPQSKTIETEIELYSYVASIGVNQVRNYFNRPLVHAVINRHGRGGRYVDKVIDYCTHHLQAVLDEFVVLQLGNTSSDAQNSKAQKLVEHIGEVFSMNSGSPNINVSERGHLKPDSRITGAAHFALAFGDDNVVEQEGGDVEIQSRKSNVRNAFNSPFWPFVLATTSVGQEGLDFHFYCRDIVHWNLPSNPVDLEQREGRLNRYNSLAIRKMIARDYPLRELTGFREQGKDNEYKGLPWQWVFQDIRSQPLNQQFFKQGLYPHWIYEPKDGNIEILRRHIMFYSNSRDTQRYKRLKRDLSIYRLVFGQPRQQDIVRRIRENLGENIDEEILDRFLPIYMINLSPFTGELVWQSALNHSRQIISSREFRDQFLKMVEQFMDEHESHLSVAKSQIINLMKIVANHRCEDGETNECLKSTAALYYLVNPYDDVYDFYHGIGFDDDIEHINRVHAEVCESPTAARLVPN